MNSKEVKKMIAALEEKKKKPGRPGKKYLYFAYGSNINMKQMAMRCPDSVPMFKATLHNAKMLFRCYADVEYEQKKRAFVKGVVYEITKDCMKALDRYEGYPRFYKKVKCIVQGPYDKYYEAFMYVMQKDVRPLELPTEQYFSAIGQGYSDWNIPVTSLCRAWEDTAILLGEIEKMEVK